MRPVEKGLNANMARWLGFGSQREILKGACLCTGEREVKKMGHPVTTNPLIIMLINMSIVFAVLIGLSVMIRLIHLVDPTKEK